MEIDSVIVAETEQQTTAQLKQTTRDLYKFCVVQGDEIQAKLHSDLRVAEYLLTKGGGISLATMNKPIGWKVVNPFIKEENKVKVLEALSMITG